MKDKMLRCDKCENKFMWSKEEQELYKERELEEPKYCPICRGMMEAEKTFMEKMQKGGSDE